MKEFFLDGIGTKWQIVINEKEENFSVEKVDKVLLEIKNKMAEYEKVFSRFLPDSLVTEISKKAGEYVLPFEAKEMFDLYKDLYDLTDGVVTPLIGNTISDIGYDAVYSLKPKENISRPKAWEEVLDYKYPNLVVKEPVLLDFGALGKGQMIDIVANILKSHGVENFMVNAGGDIAYQDKKEFLRVGLEDPEDFSQAIGVAKINNQSLCSSAGSRRKWGEYTHIINPKTLKSPKDILALWVIAPKTILADGLATALFFVSPEKLVKKYTFDYMILFADHSVRYSPFFKGELFISKKENIN